jgi:hypothetical protein
MEADYGIRVHGTVVQELCDGKSGGDSALGLGGSESAKHHEHGRIDGLSIVQEGTDDLLQFGLAGFGEGHCGIGWSSELYLGAIGGGSSSMGGML